MPFAANRQVGELGWGGGGRLGQDVEFCGAAMGLNDHFCASCIYSPCPRILTALRQVLVPRQRAKGVPRHHLYGLTGCTIKSYASYMLQESIVTCGNTMPMNWVYVIHHICGQPTMHDHARVHLFTLTASSSIPMHISIVTNQPWPMTANIFLFSFLDLKTSSGAPEQEVTLYITFGKNAKRLEHLSANTPRWIIELSVRQWCSYAW